MEADLILKTVNYVHAGSAARTNNNYIILHTSCRNESKSDWVLDKAMTSAPHLTNIFAVSRPIPVQKICIHIFYLNTH